VRYGFGARSVLIPIWGFFERRGRKGFAEGAEKKIPKKYKNLEKDKEEKRKVIFMNGTPNHSNFLNFFVFLFAFFFVFSFDSLCALCVQKIPAPYPPPFLSI
jgi:hypothetical protein